MDVGVGSAGRGAHVSKVRLGDSFAGSGGPGGLRNAGGRASSDKVAGRGSGGAGATRRSKPGGVDGGDAGLARKGGGIDAALRKQPRPTVSCAAWGIADAATGSFLLGDSESKPRQIASITKVMTAHLVLVAAREEPELLDELILISPEASRVGGTTARLQTGEVYTVADLIYGMLLPSGNDAAAALAEYLGDSFDPPKGMSSHRDVHPWTRFVAEMNREAARLGLRSTSFGNCHGLQSSKLKSTVVDVLRMTAVVMREPFFRKVVSSTMYKANVRVLRKVLPRGGNGSGRRYPYVATWKNTNTLLDSMIRGIYPPGFESLGSNYAFDGVKTGITKPAGGCLVTHIHKLGEKGKKGSATTEDAGLLVVVLGSAGTEERFIDTRRVVSYALAQLKV